MTAALHQVQERALRLGATIYYRSLRAAGVVAVKRRLRNAGLILCYHNVVADEDRAGDPGLHMRRERFESQMRWLSAHYDVLSLRELIDRLVAGGSLRATAAITFDDGYAGVFEHAVPILDALGLPATVFIVAEAPGRWPGFWWDQPEAAGAVEPTTRDRWLIELRGDGEAILAGDTLRARRGLPAAYRPADWATIRARVGGHIGVGVHSATHRSLPTLTDEELEREVVTSRAMLHRAVGIWPEFFAYPYGHWDPRVRAFVLSAGYRAGLTLDAGLNDAPDDLWCLRRVNISAAISDAAFQAWAVGLQGWRRD